MSSLSLSSSPGGPTLQNPKSYSNQSLSSAAVTPFTRLNPKFFLRSNVERLALSLKCRYQNYSDKQQQGLGSSRYPSNDSSFGSQPGAGLPPRFFVGHSIYKGKAVLSVEPRMPEFTPLDSGDFKLSKEGFVLLQFAPSAGVRQYDWSRKQVFSLSVTEIGSLISLGTRDSCEFFHDPYKGKSDEGKVRKVLKVEPLPDGSGHFFNLSVQNKIMNVDESIYIPITKAEYAVLVSAFNFILPYLLGWHAAVNAVKPEDAVSASARTMGSAESEWNR